MSDTTKNGTLSKIQEYCLSLAKTKAKRLLQGPGRILRFTRGLMRNRPKTSRLAPLAETLSPKPHPERPRTDLQFSDSLETGLGGRTRNLRPDRTPLAKRHVRIKCTQPLPQTSAARRYSVGRTTDRTGTGHSRGYLPLYSPLCSLLTLILPCAT